MDNAEEIEARRLQRLSEAFNSTDPGRQHTLVEVEVIKVPANVDELKDRVEKIDTRLGMVEQAVASIDTVLIGRDGKGGAIDRLEKGQAETRHILQETTKEITSAVKGMSNLHHNDVNEMDGKIRENQTGIKENRETIAENKEKIESHLEKHKKKEEEQIERRGHRRWDLAKSMINVTAGAFLTLLVGVALYFWFGIGG